MTQKQAKLVIKDKGLKTLADTCSDVIDGRDPDQDEHMRELRKAYLAVEKLVRTAANWKAGNVNT